MQCRRKIKNNQIVNGFTLIEMVVVIIILGVMVSFTVSMFSGVLGRYYDKNTFSNIDKIADAIAVYAERNMRVPCPADPIGVSKKTKQGEPFGTEVGSGPDGTEVGNCPTIKQAEGIVPFITLGIPLNLVKDGYGNFITYRASVTSAVRPGKLKNLPINNWCMTRPHWYKDTDLDGISETYVSLEKAAFCCGTWGAGETDGVEGDVVIKNSAGPTPYLTRSAMHGGLQKEYRKYTQTPPTYQELVGSRILGIQKNKYTVIPTFPAYVLVSHGQNAEGIFNSQNGKRYTRGIKKAEFENANGDTIFLASNRMEANAHKNENFVGYIDDIVFWETPAHILSRFGGMSCNKP